MWISKFDVECAASTYSHTDTIASKYLYGIAHAMTDAGIARLTEETMRLNYGTYSIQLLLNK